MGHRSGAAVNDGRVEEERLSQSIEALETALVTPVVPGETIPWLTAVQKRLAVTRSRFEEAASRSQADAIAQIGRTDPALLHRVHGLEAEADSLVDEWRDLCAQAELVSELASEMTPDEAKVQAPLAELTGEALETVLKTRGQLAAVRTWTFEAFERDRGGGD